MAIRTVGTVAATTLQGLLFNTDDLATGLSQTGVALMAAITAAIKNDLSTGPVQGESFSRNGMLYVPNRGVLRARPGDVVAVDTQTGWPILISAAAFAGGAWSTVAPT
jgi:hypothetical protein